MLGLPQQRTGENPSADLLARRAAFPARPLSDSADINIADHEYDEVRCRLFQTSGHALIVYAHGGGYRMGGIDSYSWYAETLAQRTGASVALVEYRLAPEHPFPAGLSDFATVYQALAPQYPDNVVLAGDSAGGGMAAGLALLTASTGGARPAGVAMLSPWLDVASGSKRFQSAEDVLFDHATAVLARDAYLQGHASDDPLVSPLVGDLTNFPPSLIQVGSKETLLGDALGFAEALADHHVDCALEIYARQGHTWPLIESASEETKRALDSLARFVDRVTTRSTI